MSPSDLEEQDFARSKLYDEKKSALRRYGELVLDEFSLLGLIKYELITTLFGYLPGPVGLVLRKIFFPMLFKDIGKGVIFGRNLTIRHAHKMVIGDGVIIDDGCLLDARGAEDEKLIIGDGVIIARSCYIQSKVGALHIGKGSDVGTSSTIVAQGGVYIGEKVGIAGGCKISGGLFELAGDFESDQVYRRFSKGPINIERCCLLGMGAIILDNVTVGEGSMVGSGAIVSSNLPAHAIVSPRPGIVIVNKPKEEE